MDIGFSTGAKELFGVFCLGYFPAARICCGISLVFYLSDDCLLEGLEVCYSSACVEDFPTRAKEGRSYVLRIFGADYPLYIRVRRQINLAFS